MSMSVRYAFFKYALQVKGQSGYVKASNWGGSTGVKWGQEGPKGVKWGQVRLSRVKWGLVGNMVRGLVFGRVRGWVIGWVSERFGER